ncbi:hypothetical protein [Desulfitobacterium sp. PCE1]|uniref:hypothetical protein n=1 Tax=Desulfitobacterium sp. PCE1 TaxID=146907 RepID=UPI00037C5009|nr:hypothetical protein [Desulfitobacterium sp. PCE1]
MKKFFSLFLLVPLVLFLAGCGGEGVTAKKGETAEQSVKKALNAIKAADTETASKYIDYNELVNAGSTKSLDTEDEKKSEDMSKMIFKNIEYKILESSEEEKTAVVKTEITNLDMSNVMAGFISQLLPLAFSGLDEKQLDEKSFEIFTNLVSSETKTVTKTVGINLSKGEEGWKIVGDDVLADALTGGLVSFSANMNGNNGSNGDSDIGKLQEMRNWLIGKVWNEGFVDIQHYVARGKSSTGQTLDIEFTLEQLDATMKKKTDYDSFIGGLAEEQYSQIKSIWGRLSPEIDRLYDQIKGTPPVANDASNSFDTGKFEQYMDAFTDAVDDLN